MNLSPLPIQKFFDNNGRPLVGGLLFTYLAGTNTKTNTWKTAAGGPGNLNTNPITLDFRGECRLWLDPQQSYKFVLSPATDTDPPAAPIWTVDDITVSAPSFDNAADDTGSANNVVLSIPGITALVPFLRLVFKAAATNTGPVTITLNGNVPKNLTWQNIGGLDAGTIQQGGIYQAIYDGVQFQLQGPAIESSQMRTAQEIAQSVVPTAYTYFPRDVRRYGAKGDGVTNDNGAFSQDALAYSYTPKFAPEGRYLLTSFGGIDGWYGPGELSINTQRIYLPLNREQTPPVPRLMEKLSRLRGSFQQVTLIADSIGDYYYVSSENKSWFSILRDNVNFFQSSSDFDTTTNFDDPYIPTVTLGGSFSYGTAGPLGRSLILAAGGYVEFTGSYTNIEFFFQRAVGAGSFSYTYNGGAAYRTVSAAGAAQNDYNTTQVAATTPTPSSAFGTHRITATGASIEITGLQRLNASGYASGPNQIRFCRIARAGYSTTQFANATRLASIKIVGASSAPASFTTKQALYIVALGTNNAYNVTNQTTPNQFLFDLIYIFSMLREAGAVIYICPFEPGRATVSGSSYDSYAAAAKFACDSMRVPFLTLNDWDWLTSTTVFTQDNLHPNDNGNDKYAQIVLEKLCDIATDAEGPMQDGLASYLSGYSYFFNAGGLSTGTPNFGICLGCYYNGTNFTALHTQASIIQNASGGLVLYLNTGLTPGSTFAATEAARFDGTVFKPAAAMIQKAFNIAYSASVTPNAAQGNLGIISVSNTSAFTINAPTNPAANQRLTIQIRNASGGAMGVITWNAVFKMSAWTNPANSFNRSIDFYWDTSNWVQIGQTGVDVPN